MSINIKPKILKVATAFSGGLAAFEFAFRYENIPHEIVFACEWDKYARKQYIKFHGLPKLFFNDIKQMFTMPFKILTPKIDNIDLFVWGSPCQDLSLSGKRKGLKGSKSSHFWHGLRVQGEIMPNIFVFENVPGLLSSNGGADYKTVCNEFRKQGYHIHTSKLNAKDFEDPQNRDRIFIIGFLDVEEYHRFKEPEKLPLKKCLKDVLQKWVPEKYFLSQKMIDGFIAHKKRHEERETGFKFIPKNSNDIANCLRANYFKMAPTDNYIKYKINSNTKSGYETAKDYDCIDLARPTSTTRRGRVGKGYAQTLECGGNIGVIYNFMIRRLTPYETFRLQGLKDEDIKLIVSDTQAYKISGNAINVSVARSILKALYKNQVTQKISLFDFI